MISLKKLLLEACPDQLAGFFAPELPIQGIECDSRKVRPDFVFVAIRGAKHDGHLFIKEAVSRGAVAVVAEQATQLSPKISFLRVPDSRRALARLAGAFYSHPSRAMKVVGITGTNGKTTSAFLIEHLLRCEHISAGVIGTIHYRFAGKEVPAAETTPGPLRLQALLSQMEQNRCGYVVMEVSAHAIDQSRIEDIFFQVALFTNLTQDHLDYFGSLDRYFACKASLFTSLLPGQCAVLNQDDTRVRSLGDKTRARVISFGIQNPADLKAEITESSLSGTRFRLLDGPAALSVEIPLAGVHNVYNALGSLAVMKALGFDLAAAARNLASFEGVPGRLEPVDRGQNFFVFVDYAHTPDGLENVLKCLRPYKKAKLITVFGCGGDRDRGKRPRMAKIAGEYSDYVVVTSDNPRSEDPSEIAGQIRAGFSSNFKNYAVTLDRKKAIRQALLMARKNDVVVLAGKGHETTQVVGNEAFPFNDREEAERVLDGR